MKSLYLSLTKKRKEIEKGKATYLYQKDFQKGTYLIDKPGYYVLKEDIVFSPNPNNDYMPMSSQSEYQTPGFILGFFSVIAIYAKGVYLDLNNHSISASPEFALQQRFFSLIELANSPFTKGQGPGAFSSETSFLSSEDVFIRNGKLGLSSHHGIHGNLSENVLLENLIIENFEFVGIALNGSNNFLTHRVEIKNNRQDIPVLATYSAARFSRLFAKNILTRYPLSNNQKVELVKKVTALEKEMNSTFDEIKKTGKTTNPLFENKSGLPDGNVYGFLAKNPGFAVNEFVSPDPSVVKANNIFLRKVKISNLKARVDEVVALSGKGGIGVQNDVAGAVLQVDHIQDSEGRYRGNALSNLQLYLAELALELNIPLGKSNITLDTINWCKSGESISNLLEKGYVYKCNGDSMAHISKGILAYRFDAIDNLFLDKCSASNIKNYGALGNDKAAGAYEKSLDASKRKGYTGNGTFGIHLSYCSNVSISKFIGEKLMAKDGPSTGINLIFSCTNVKLDEVEFHNIKAGTLHKGRWIGKNYFGEHVPYENTLPNFKPIAIGISYQGNSIVDMKEISISDLRSCEDAIKISHL